jgi:hypothetical protein
MRSIALSGRLSSGARDLLAARKDFAIEISPLK